MPGSSWSHQAATTHTLPTSQLYFPFLLTPEIETFHLIKFKAFLENLIVIIDFASVSTKSRCLPNAAEHSLACGRGFIEHMGTIYCPKLEPLLIIS